MADTETTNKCRDCGGVHRVGWEGIACDERMDPSDRPWSVGGGMGRYGLLERRRHATKRFTRPFREGLRATFRWMAGSDG